MRQLFFNVNLVNMSKTIIQALLNREPNAISRATKWMTQCQHTSPEVWFAYSKLMIAYFNAHEHYAPQYSAFEHAWPIARYYTLALETLKTQPCKTESFLLLHDTIELWSRIPSEVWLALQQQWSATALYKWSMDNENVQQTALNTRIPGKFHAEPLHDRMGVAILEKCANGLPLLLDASVHGDLWRVFNGEQIYQTRHDLTKRIDKLVLAAPASFEYAVTGFYQRSPGLWTHNRVAVILNMDMTQGHPLTVCSSLLLLYADWRYHLMEHKIFAGIQSRYPALLSGFDLHLALYPNKDDALLHTPAIMDHWMRSVHNQNCEESVALPNNLESQF